jgi:hypothetical protein
MAKKSAGPKETALRQMREGHTPGTLDPTDLKAQIDALEEEHRQKRLALLHPIDEQIKFHQDALDGLLKIKADLSGKPQTQAVGGSGKRVSSAEKLKLYGQPMYDFISKGKKEGYLKEDLQHLTGGYEPNDIRKIWNEAHPDQKIVFEGAKASARYVLA